MRTSMWDYLPEWWQDSPEVGELEEALTRQAEGLAEGRTSFARQLDLDTATWSLPIWERQVGIIPPPGADYAARRRAIRAAYTARQRPTPKVITEVIASVAGSGTTTITEDCKDRSFTAKITDLEGTAPTRAALDKALVRALPVDIRFGGATTLHKPLPGFGRLYSAAVGGIAHTRTTLSKAKASTKIAGRLYFGTAAISAQRCPITMRKG